MWTRTQSFLQWCPSTRVVFCAIDYPPEQEFPENISTCTVLPSKHRHLPRQLSSLPKSTKPSSTTLTDRPQPPPPPRTRVLQSIPPPSPTPLTPPPTPSKATSDPRRRLAGRFPAFPRGPREKERGKKQATTNRQPPDPTRPDPADRRVSSSSPRAPKHCIAPPPPRFPRARHGTPPTLVRGLHRSGRDAPCRSRAFARVGGGEGNTIDDAIPRERWSRHTHIPSSRPAFQARLSSSSSTSPSRDPSHHPPSIDRPTLSSPVTHRGRTAHVSPHPSRSRLSPTAVSLVVCSRVSPTTRTTSHPPVQTEFELGLDWTPRARDTLSFVLFFLPSYVPRQWLFFSDFFFLA